MSEAAMTIGGELREAAIEDARYSWMDPAPRYSARSLLLEKAADALDAAQERERKMREALEKIAAPLDCGCRPCRGQCRSQEALQITVDALQDIARAALGEPNAST